MTITSRLDFDLDPDADLAYQWDTQRKLSAWQRHALYRVLFPVNTWIFYVPLGIA